MNLRKATPVFILFIIIFLYGCTNELAIVNSPNGLILRETPSISSKRILFLIDKTNLIILGKGIPDTIDGKRNNWYKVQTGREIGWVFGAYISKNIPAHYKIEYMYSAAANSTAIIYLSLYKNHNFDLYFESLLNKSSDDAIVTGKWNIKNNEIILIFDKNQKTCPKCDIKVFFIKPDGKKWDNRINIINNYTYAFDKSAGGIVLWGVSCTKYQY